jgi:hypothetical protein
MRNLANVATSQQSPENRASAWQRKWKGNGIPGQCLSLKFSNLVNPAIPPHVGQSRANPQTIKVMKSAHKLLALAGLLVFLSPSLLSCKASAATNKHEFKKELHKMERSKH